MILLSASTEISLLLESISDLSKDNLYETISKNLSILACQIINPEIYVFDVS